MWSSGPADRTLRLDDLVTTDDNRWSRSGEPTIYLSEDPAVALAEFARHWDGRTPSALWRVRVRTEQIADLTDAPGTADAPSDPRWVLDPDQCLAVAEDLRSTGLYAGIKVPSMAFLDDLSHWNLVLFADRLGSAIDHAVSIECVEQRLVAARQVEDVPAG
jgi:RES domain-containing protein